MKREPKIHFDTQVTVSRPNATISLCQRHVYPDARTRDPGAVTCYQCRVRMQDRNPYWLKCRTNEDQ